MLTSLARAVIATNAFFMVVSGVIVYLRINARKQKAPPLRADDYLIVAAWGFSAALAITNIVGVPVGGFGTQFELLSDKQVVNFLKILFVLQFWYIFAVALVKLSILCFYGRIFATHRFLVVIRIMMAITIAWLITFFFATLFQILPIRCNWMNCPNTVNYSLIYAMCSVTDIILDIIILCLPTSFLWNLQMSRSKKVGVAGIFGLGIFCIISSIARLVYAVRLVEVNVETDFASNFDKPVVSLIMWSGIEACASTICANLPCYCPLVRSRAGPSSFITRTLAKFSGHNSGSDSCSPSVTRPSLGRSKSSRESRPPRPSRNVSRELTSSTERIVDDGPKFVNTVVSESGTRCVPETELEMGLITVETTTLEEDRSG